MNPAKFHEYNPPGHSAISGAGGGGDDLQFLDGPELGDIVVSVPFVLAWCDTEGTNDIARWATTNMQTNGSD